MGRRADASRLRLQSRSKGPDLQPRALADFAPGARTLLSTRLGERMKTIQGAVRVAPYKGIVLDLSNAAETQAKV